jgi:hypothetical protein
MEFHRSHQAHNLNSQAQILSRQPSYHARYDFLHGTLAQEGAGSVGRGKLPRAGCDPRRLNLLPAEWAQQYFRLFKPDI